MKTSVLRPNEGVKLNSDRLAELYVQLGEKNAQDVVCRAMEELALRLARIEEGLRAGDRAVVFKGAKSLVGIADQIGMDSLASAAGHVRDCADWGDETSLAATTARLVRIGDRSLMAVWDLQDLSI